MALARLLLADDHVMFVQALAKLLRSRFDLVDIVENGRALWESSLNHKPDVIVTDITMPLMNGIEAVRRLRKEGVLAKIIFLTMHADDEIVAECFRAGASGFVNKACCYDELLVAIDVVLNNNFYIPPGISADVLTNDAKPAGGLDLLTSRQREILQLFAEGNTAKEIASLMNLSTRTIEWHKYRMMRALHVESSAQLVRYAVKSKLVA
jgi:DNA-binding NarL/FixJ family response regulator